MAKKRLTPMYPADWTVETYIVVNGRIVRPGTEVSVTGEPGRFRFVKKVTTDSGKTWVDLIGPIPRNPLRARSAWRSFRPERIRTVHRTTRTRGVVQ